MMEPEDPYETNRRWWQERARLHPATALYRDAADRLRQGGSTLLAIERAELGPLDGKRVLHLQCHLGYDSLSLARLGASVTGVDFSSEALSHARSLAAELALDAQFIEADVLKLEPSGFAAQDVVFTSWGAISWLGDLARWAGLVAGVLRPGGYLYLIDCHPFALCLDDGPHTPAGELRLRYPYFHGATPIRFESTGSYADRDAVTEHNRTCEWTHPISSVLTALLGNGLRLELFHEHDGGPCAMFPGMMEDTDGLWRLPRGLREHVPLSFSLKAGKPVTVPSEPPRS